MKKEAYTKEIRCFCVLMTVKDVQSLLQNIAQYLADCCFSSSSVTNKKNRLTQFIRTTDEKI